MEKLDPNDRLTDLKEALAFENHKVANINQELLKKPAKEHILDSCGLVLLLDKTS